MFVLPNLPFDYNALEPYIDEETMRLHHDKHHAGYINNLNKALENYPDLQNKNIIELLKGDIPEDIKQAVINNGGGHFNHSFFWEIMKPSQDKQNINKDLYKILESTFGSFEKFKESFKEKAMSVFGSGWAWMLLTPDKKIVIKRHSFQNPPIMGENIPLLGLDVWEHAYYLKYQNRRADYIDAWFNVVNWDKVYEIYSQNK